MTIDKPVYWSDKPDQDWTHHYTIGLHTMMESFHDKITIYRSIY